MNAGIYREGTPAGGLPLPRRNLWLFTILVAVLALVALVLSPGLLAFASRESSGLAGVWRTIKEGGVIWMGSVLFLNLLLPVAVAVLGAFVLRGKRIPPVLLFFAPVLPLIVGMLGAFVGHSVTFSAIGGESVDPEQKARIMAEGAAEAMKNDVLSGFVCCGVAIVAAAAAASAAATIDVASAARGERPTRAGFAGATIAGALWVLAAIALAGLRLRYAGPLVLFTALATITLVPFAILAARGAAILGGWHDRAEASRVLAAIAIAALSAVLGIVALERAAQATVTTQALQAISGESVDPSQQMRILAEAVEGLRFGRLALFVHGFFALATFAAALAPAALGGPNARRHPFGASTFIALGLALALVAGDFGLAWKRTRTARAVAAAQDQVSPPGVTLPVVQATFSRKEYPGFENNITVGANAVEGEGGPAGCAPRYGTLTKLTFYADRAVTAARIGAILTRRDCDEPDLVFVARREHDPAIAARLGDMASYLGATAYLGGMLSRESSRKPGLEVRSIADDAIEIDGRRVPLPIPPGTTLDTSVGYGGTVRYSFRPADTVERIVQTIAGVREASGGRLQSAMTLIDLGLPSRKPPVPKAPSVRQGTMQVTGGLPPEVIQRVVRQSFGGFRLCYERGLTIRPTLAGRVTVKFVIGRDGAVTSAKDGGSDLPDKSVVSCVVGFFKRLSFPQPDAGVVTVTYPLIFEPGD